MFPLFLFMISGITLEPRQSNTCDLNACILAEQKMPSEAFMLEKKIKYARGGNGPIYYDCGGVLTEAMRQEGYIGKKIHSRFLKCRKPNTEARAGDILINQNEDQRHVALITSDYEAGSVEILDYYLLNSVASYRRHSFYKNIFTLDKSCLLSLKSYEPL